MTPHYARQTNRAMGKDFPELQFQIDKFCFILHIEKNNNNTLHLLKQLCLMVCESVFQNESFKIAVL